MGDFYAAYPSPPHPTVISRIPLLQTALLAPPSFRQFISRQEVRLLWPYTRWCPRSRPKSSLSTVVKGARETDALKATSIYTRMLLARLHILERQAAVIISSGKPGYNGVTSCVVVYIDDNEVMRLRQTIFFSKQTKTDD